VVVLLIPELKERVANEVDEVDRTEAMTYLGKHLARKM